MVSSGASLPWGWGEQGLGACRSSPEGTPVSLRPQGQASPVYSPGFDSDLLTLVPALGKNKSLKHLFLGKNFNVKAK